MGAHTTTAVLDAPITDLSTLPLILKLDDIVRIVRRGRSTIDRELANGTFRPAPFAKFPYRWRRVDIERELEKPQPGVSVPITRPRRRRRTAA